MFFLIVLAVLGVVYGYTCWRLITPAALALPWKVLVWAGLLLLLFLPPSLLFLRRYLANTWWGDLLAWVGFIGMGFVTLTFSLLLLRDLLWLGWRGLDLVISLVDIGGRAEAQPLTRTDPERRLCLLQATNLGILGLTSILSGYGLYKARRAARVFEIPVPIEDLPASLDGFRIAQISDIHVGPTIKRGYVQRIVDQVNELAPDVVALTGDLPDGSVADLRRHVAPLAGLQARDGCYFVTGNHEYYAGVDDWIGEARRLGFEVLVNEHRLVERGSGRILLAGVTDYGGGQFGRDHDSDPKAAIAGAPESHARILLAHQPLSIFAAARAGFDLQLSGHTHGGQFIPWKYLVGLQQPYTAGLHRFEHTWIYVNRGTGYWGPPLRLGTDSEITLITLRAAAGDADPGAIGPRTT